MNANLLKIQACIVLCLLAILPLVGFAQVKPYGTDVIQGAQDVISKYNAGAKKANNVVKIVYFYGRDIQPLDNWNERLTRVLNSVNDFYTGEFKRYDIKTGGINFERSGKKYVITLIQADNDTKTYNQNSSGQIQKEIYQKADGRIDFSRDYVLILTGLSFIRAGGIYEFHSPYEGDGAFDRGVCFASDCELLDPQLLTDTVNHIKFTEPERKLTDITVAEFNSWYIGGIAHEMGHMFGLHHDAGNPAEFDASTISLMGSGNYYFGSDLWGKKKTVHLSASGVLQLLGHPVFSNSRKGIDTNPRFTISDVKIEVSDSLMLLKTAISCSATPYALTVLVHSNKVDEYHNESGVFPISSTGPISIPLKNWPVGAYELRLIFTFPNGHAQVIYKKFQVDGTSKELATLPSHW